MEAIDILAATILRLARRECEALLPRLRRAKLDCQLPIDVDQSLERVAYVFGGLSDPDSVAPGHKLPEGPLKLVASKLETRIDKLCLHY